MRLSNKLLMIVSLAGLALAVAVGIFSNPTPPKTPPGGPAGPGPLRDLHRRRRHRGAALRDHRDRPSVAGIVRAVLVTVGDRVKAGDPLFLVDDREARAELAVKEAELAAARAAVEEARASHKDYATQYALVRDVTDHRAVSRDDVEQRKNAELLARAKVDSAVVAVESAQAGLEAARTALELLTVRAPIDAEVLQVNVRAGEYAATGVLDTPLVRLGDVTALHVRTDIDETDAWRFTPGTRAVAFIRGNRDLRAEMRFVRVEPYVGSKTQLSGTSTERVDTRVLQVLFRLEKDALPVYVGQQMDVFIETPSPATAAAPAAPAAPAGTAAVRPAHRTHRGRKRRREADK
jgi:multidrug efflux pump subunit AcrA (membrane-fusion protein)